MTVNDSVGELSFTNVMTCLKSMVADATKLSNSVAVEPTVQRSSRYQTSSEIDHIGFIFIININDFSKPSVAQIEGPD